MEDNTSKVLVAGDANLAVAALLNPDAGAGSSPGSSLFVVNLCASMAPIANVGKTLPGLENHRLYQVSRREDGRTRYRLRLGFFTSEADAEAVLNSVRDQYPTAFTACLCDEDRKFARGFVPEQSLAAVPPRKPAAVAPKIAVVETKPAVAAKPAQQPAKPVAPSKPLDLGALIGDPLESTAKHKRITPPPTPIAKAAPAPKQAPKQTVTPAASPAPVAESVEIELSWEPPALQPAPDATPQVVAAGFKTQEVIKAPAPPVAKKAVAEPAKMQTPQPAPKKDTIESPSKLLQNIELTLENDAKPTPPKPASSAPSSEPFRVGKGVDIPKTSLTLETEVAAKPPAAAPAKPAAPAPVKPAIAATVTPVKPMADVSKMKAAQAGAPTAIKAAVAPPTAVRKVDGPPPDLDSTQTIRALTSDELKDDSQEKWFSIQLAVSDQPVNLDTMPRLDIFEAYRLYSVASAGSGKITHSLRLGFFREEHSAEAVNGYLKTFFNSPTVVRISIAEQSRFKDAPAPKAAPKATEAKVLDLSHARDRAPKVVPTVTMEVETKKFDPMATGSFKANATGTHKSLSASGSHNVLSATGTHKMTATGAHKAFKAASKSATPPTKRSQPLTKSSATGKHKALQKKSLSEELLDEAREVELSQSGIRKIPKNDSLFSKMFGKKK